MKKVSAIMAAFFYGKTGAGELGSKMSEETDTYQSLVVPVWDFLGMGWKQDPIAYYMGMDENSIRKYVRRYV